jgi:hypothetical protein
LNLFFILRDPEGGPERGLEGGPDGGPDEGGPAFVPSRRHQGGDWCVL